MISADGVLLAAGDHVETLVLGEWLPGMVDADAGDLTTGSIRVVLDRAVDVPGCPVPMRTFYRCSTDVRTLG